MSEQHHAAFSYNSRPLCVCHFPLALAVQVILGQPGVGFMTYAVDLWGMGITLFLLVFGSMEHFVFSPPTTQAMQVYSQLSVEARGFHRAELRGLMKKDHDHSMTRLLHAAADGWIDSTTFVWLQLLLSWNPSERMELFSTSQADMAKAIKSAERLIDSVRKSRQTGQGGQAVGGGGAGPIHGQAGPGAMGQGMAMAGGGRAQPALQQPPVQPPIVNAPRIEAAVQAPVEVPRVEALVQAAAPVHAPINAPHVEAPAEALVVAPVQPSVINAPRIEARVQAPVEGPRLEVAVSAPRRGVDEHKTAALLSLLSMDRSMGTTAAAGGGRAPEAAALRPPQQGLRQGAVGVDVAGTAVLKAFLGMGQPEASRGVQRAEATTVKNDNNHGRLTGGAMAGRHGGMNDNEGRRINRRQGGGDRAPVQAVGVQGGKLQECNVGMRGTHGAQQAGVQSTRGPQPRGGREASGIAGATGGESEGGVGVVPREHVLLINNQMNHDQRGVREGSNNAGDIACEHDRSGGRRRRAHQRRRSKNHRRRGTAERPGAAVVEADVGGSERAGWVRVSLTEVFR